MGEILQNSEEYILQFYNDHYERWEVFSHYCTLDEAKENQEEIDMYETRIVKETIRQEVVG